MKTLILGKHWKINKLSNLIKKNAGQKRLTLIFIDSWFDSVSWSCVQIYHMTILYTQTLTAPAGHCGGGLEKSVRGFGFWQSLTIEKLRNLSVVWSDRDFYQ
jgi:hypothetical protein